MFIFAVCNRTGRFMLFIAAIARLARPPESTSHDLLVHSRVGNAALAVIALIYVLVTLWQR